MAYRKKPDAQVDALELTPGDLATLMELNGWTADTLGPKIGVSRSTVYAWLKGTPIDFAHRYCIVVLSTITLEELDEAARKARRAASPGGLG